MTVGMTDMNMLGAGFCRIDGAAVFVPGAVDGDICEITPDGNGKNFRTAKLERIVTPSEHRCESGCDAFGICGGCTLRHITYGHELEIKRRGVMQAFRKNGMTVDIPDVVGTAETEYRNKAIFHNRGGKLAYFAGQSHDAVYPSSGRCAIIPAIFDEIRKSVEGLLSDAHLELSLYLRIGDGGEVCCTFCDAAAEVKASAVKALAEAVMERFPSVVSVYLASGEVGAPKCRYTLISGKAEIGITVGSIRFGVTPASFFQVNIAGANELVRRVVAFAGLGRGERCADLYCGAGMFALNLAMSCEKAKIIGIEINEAAVDSAKRNAAMHGIDNARFYAGDAVAFADRLEGISCAVVDPPRAGLSKKLIGQLMGFAPERIVYVSCNPETLARDVRVLREMYEIGGIVCVDMFPRTGHCESVIQLSKVHN